MGKIRLNRELYERACECAAAVDEPVGRWLTLCQRMANCIQAAEYLTMRGVAVADDLGFATRLGSLTATVEGDVEDAALFRRNVAIVVTYCELVRLPEFVTEKVQGIDYLVEDGD